MKQVLSFCTAGSTPVLSEAQLQADATSGTGLAKEISEPNAPSISLSPWQTLQSILNSENFSSPFLQESWHVQSQLFSEITAADKIFIHASV